MIRGENWIAWDVLEAPALPGTKPAARSVREQPFQEQQYGSNIDTLPIESNAPAPTHSRIVSR